MISSAKIYGFLSLAMLLVCATIGVAQPTITGISTTTISAGTKSVLNITGTNFGTGGPGASKYVEFKNADDGGTTWIQPIPSEYVSWNNTSIQVQVPSGAGTGSGAGSVRVTNGTSNTWTTSILTVTYNYLNVTSGNVTYEPDHIDGDGSGGYTWQMFTDFDAAALTKASFERALETWRCNTYVNWNIGSVTTVDVIASDGINVVRMDNGSELPAGVLGRCTSRWTACNSGGWEWWVYELDIAFDDGTNWQYGPAGPGGAQYDFESVAVHELGHGHQLGHVIASGGDVMHYAIANGVSQRALTANNITGGNDVMTNSTAANSCPEDPMTLLTAGNCALACVGNEPGNDAICSATALVLAVCATGQTNTCATDQGYAFGCGTGTKSVWYTASVTGGNDQLDITFANTTFGTDIEVYLYNGACGGPVAISSVCGPASNTFSFTGVSAGGSPYLIGVGTGSTGVGDFDICVNQATTPCGGGPPTNDAICSATVLPNGGCFPILAENNTCALADNTFGCATSDKTLWYSVTMAGANDDLVITFANSTLGGDVHVAIYSGVCGSPTGVYSSCGPAAGNFWFYPLTPLSTYLVSVSTDAADVGLYDICGTQSVSPCTGNEPGNDECSAPTTLPVDNTCLTNQTNQCSTQDYTFGCSTDRYTVWYQFTLGASASVLDVTFPVNTFGDTVEVAVWTNVCPTPVGVTAYCAAPNGTFKFTGLTPSSTYLLSVATAIADTGSFSICAQEAVDCGVSQPAIDSICGSLTVPTNGTCLTGQSNLCATSEGFGSYCVDSLGGATVWFDFSITAPSNRVQFTLQNTTWSSSTQVQMLIAELTAGCPGAIAVSILYGVCGAPTDTFDFPTNLTPGNTYYLMVQTDTLETGDFDICGQEYEVPPATLTGPEQDCDGAIPICGPTYVEINAYSGFGNVQEITNICFGCPSFNGGETNSVWYTWTVQSSGTMFFEIVTTDLYDWALYDITTIGCAGIPTVSSGDAEIPRCAFSNTVGNTGASGPAVSNPTPTIGACQFDPPNVDGINVVVGQVFALEVDNWFGNNNGYIINIWGTAQVWDNVAPDMTSVTSCATTVITLIFDEQIKCDSITAGEFILTNITTGTDYSSAITGIAGVGCPGGGGGYTNQIDVTHSGIFPAGTYTLGINLGVIEDRCGNKAIVGDTIVFTYLLPPIFTASADTICTTGDSVRLTADIGQDIYQGSPPAGLTYTLNPGAVVNTTGIFDVNPLVTTVYTIDVSFGGCTKSASVTVEIVNNVVASISPVDPTVCSTPTALTASATVNGGPCASCIFQWDDGSSQTTSVATGLGVGTYSVTVTTPQGCEASNVPSSTVSIAGGGPGASCDVIYVSVLGGGDGLTKNTPTDIKTALIDAACTNTVIKCQVGTYPFNEYLDVKSFVTIEGGYNSGGSPFTTKTSDLTGGGNSTTFVRQATTPDGGAGLIFSMFKVNGGEVDFRFQDIRIEMPTTHTAGTEYSNYGINLGAACSGYSIIRCYIDAGTGAN